MACTTMSVRKTFSGLIWQLAMMSLTFWWRADLVSDHLDDTLSIPIQSECFAFISAQVRSCFLILSEAMLSYCTWFLESRNPEDLLICTSLKNRLLPLDFPDSIEVRLFVNQV
jgi:hypothetical protein